MIVSWEELSAHVPTGQESSPLKRKNTRMHEKSKGEETTALFLLLEEGCLFPFLRPVSLTSRKGLQLQNHRMVWVRSVIKVM